VEDGEDHAEDGDQRDDSDENDDETAHVEALPGLEE